MDPSPSSKPSETSGSRTGAQAGAPACPLCAAVGGRLAWQDEAFRVVLPDEPDYPGFVRVIAQSHVAEMTDLPASERQRLMALVWQVERLQRDILLPDKINLASLGNQVPHLHWHLIPRWRDDRHFPGAIWSSEQRAVSADWRAARLVRLELLVERLAELRACDC